MAPSHQPTHDADLSTRGPQAVGWASTCSGTSLNIKEFLMVVQAYILIQTDVGKAAEVATAIAQISGVPLAEDVTGPYDVIVRSVATTLEELGKPAIGKQSLRNRVCK